MNEYQYRARLRADGHDSDTIAERVDNWASDAYDRRADLQPGIPDALALALRGVRPPLPAAERTPWPFPARLVPTDRTPAPDHPDPEDAPW